MVLAYFLIQPFPAHALTFEDGADAPTRTIEDYIKDFVDIPEGALDWKIFGQTKEISVEGKDKEGYDFKYYKPGFSDAVKKLDGTEIMIKGFMFPLDSTEEQKTFLFGPFPINCPFQYHVGPSLVLEVHAGKDLINFSYDPLTLKGILRLVDTDLENSTFYRLEKARIVKE